MLRKTLGSGVSAAALILAITFPAGALSAQTTTQATPPAERQAADSDIVVTASRIQTAGFQAPTPTTVVDQAQLRQGGRTDISQALADLPEFRLTQSAVTTNTVTSSGQAPLDLRGLGSSRTLVLLDGHRFVSGNDSSVIPFALVKEIVTVTGGASAAWGSDAVSGVVNVVLDDNFKGLNLGVQSGISRYGDAAKQDYNIAYGAKITDKWHVMASFEYVNDHGVQPATDRPRIGATAFVAGTDGVLRATQNVYQADRALGGLIKNGPLAGQMFNDNGTLSPFQFGRVVGTTMVGGQGYTSSSVASLSAPLERALAFARTTYDVSSSFKIWAEGNFSRETNTRNFFPDLAPSQTAYTYQTANPFLPAAVRNQLTAAGVTSFTMDRVLKDIALSRYDFERNFYQGTAGFDGRIGSKWKFSGYYTHGEYTQNLQLGPIIKTAQFLQAIDAVTGPNGTPVCRVALTNPATACLPLNLFGQNNYNPAALSYVEGTWQDRTHDWLDDGGLNINGEPFQLWNRPVSIAAGIDYRKQSTQARYDATSLASGFATINGVNIGKIGNNVKEAYGEFNIPLLADLPFVEQLTLNGAGRVSKYSTFSKDIWSWKVGGIWKVTDDILFRATRSRDIRAPSLSELYSAPGTLFSGVNDLSKPAGQQAVTAILRSGGNPNLAPEKGDTLTLGAVLTPRFIPGLSFSADYYHIKIKNVITTLSAQQIINACYLQNLSAACGQLIRDASGTLTNILATYVNLASLDNAGVDFELGYHTRLEKFGMPGMLSVRALATYVDKLVSNNGVLVVDGAGFAGTQSTFLTPKWRANTTVTYESKSFGADIRGRWIDKSQFAPYQVFGVANASLVSDNIPNYFYFDLSVRGYIPAFGGHRLTVYASVANLFNRQPPIAAASSPYYDEIGRYMTVGATFKF